VALPTVSGVLGGVASQPPHSEIRACTCLSRSGSIAQARNTAILTFSKEPVVGPSGEHDWLTSQVVLTAMRVPAIGSVTPRTGLSSDGPRLRWSGWAWWAREELNLRPLPCQQNGGNRCARSRSPRSLPTVEAEGKRSLGVQGNALFRHPLPTLTNPYNTLFTGSNAAKERVESAAQ
jgi:hypothetical protein